MRTINRESQRELGRAAIRFKELIENGVDIDDMYRDLDDIMYLYTQYSISDTANCHPSYLESQLYHLKLIRDLFIVEQKENENTSK